VSSVRTCGTACHYAKHSTCNCWCGGLFHGKPGTQARAKLIQLYGVLPSKEPESSSFYEAVAKIKAELR
jgi:hypothetical protein